MNLSARAGFLPRQGARQKPALAFDSGAAMHRRRLKSGVHFSLLSPHRLRRCLSARAGFLPRQGARQKPALAFDSGAASNRRRLKSRVHFRLSIPSPTPSVFERSRAAVAPLVDSDSNQTNAQSCIDVNTTARRPSRINDPRSTPSTLACAPLTSAACPSSPSIECRGSQASPRRAASFRLCRRHAGRRQP